MIHRGVTKKDKMRKEPFELIYAWYVAHFRCKFFKLKILFWKRKMWNFETHSLDFKSMALKMMTRPKCFYLLGYIWMKWLSNYLLTALSMMPLLSLSAFSASSLCEKNEMRKQWVKKRGSVKFALEYHEYTFLL